MTAKEKELGQEIAKLALKIRRQRLRIRELVDGLEDWESHAHQVKHDLQEREIRITKYQNERLQFENRELRILIATQKIRLPWWRRGWL